MPQLPILDEKDRTLSAVAEVEEGHVRYRRLALLGLLLNYCLIVGINIYQESWLLLFSTFLWVLVILGMVLPLISTIVATIFAFIPFNNWAYIDRQKRLTWLILLAINFVLMVIIGRKILDLLFP